MTDFVLANVDSHSGNWNAIPITMIVFKTFVEIGFF